MTTTDDKLRDSRYPHLPPDEASYATRELFDAARMVFYKGQAELTESFFEALPFAAISTLHDGSIVYANAPAQRLFRLTKSDLSSRRATEFLFNVDDEPIGASIGRRVTAGEAIRQEAVYVRAGEGDAVLRMLSVAPVFVAGTQTLVRAIAFLMDPSTSELENQSLTSLNRELQDILGGRDVEVQRLREEVRDLQIQVDTDDLTGVMNKRSFSREARLRIEEQRRRRGSAGLLFLDPDDFKALNDTYGHDVGDELIQELASRGRVIAEKHGGLFARFGGDEFYAIFTDVNAEAFEAIVREYAEAMPFDSEATDIETGERRQFRVGVSFGGCYRTAGVVPDLRLLLKEADRAMFECKRSGKGPNRPHPYIIAYAPSINSSKPPIL